eukprot:34227-Chlamydomonas_euryale.AAC.1
MQLGRGWSGMAGGHVHVRAHVQLCICARARVLVRGAWLSGERRESGKTDQQPRTYRVGRALPPTPTAAAERLLTEERGGVASV